MTDTSLDHALAFARRGWRVIPIPAGQKYPAIPAWQDAATTDEALIRQWWATHPDHGIGIATGPASGIWVLDIDVAGDKAGDDTLGELEAEHGLLPDTYEVVTGSGGRHLYFAWPTDGRVIRNSASGRLGPGIDVRGEGGQVVAPPSIHANGTRYAVEASCAPGVAYPPEWLLELACEPPRESVDDLWNRIAKPSTADMWVTAGPIVADRPGDQWAASTTWDELLGSDGWTLHHVDRDGEQHWTRPGKDHREGTSATIGHKGSDRLKVFTSSVPWLNAEETYDRLQYLAQRDHGGDRGAAGRALRAEGYGAARDDPSSLIDPTTGGRTVAVQDTPIDPGPQPIDWGTFWHREVAADWLIEPVIPAGRHTVLYAPAKMGKSLLALEIAAAAATGRSVLEQAPGEPVNVVYLDFEMTEDDILERLGDMGYSEDDDLSHLFYYSLPSMPPLDTVAGGDLAVELARRHHAQLVVVDTMARVVAGKENDADTYRLFDMYTSLPLKRAGVAVLRLDHSGKDLEKGQRGSSEKAGYADLVWSLVVTETGQATLRATHRRIGWAPAEVFLQRLDEPALRHIMADNAGLQPGTQTLIDTLDRLGVDVDCSTREAQAALKAAGEGRQMGLIRAAVKVRKQRSDIDLLAPSPCGQSGSEIPGPTSSENDPEMGRTHSLAKRSDQHRTHLGPTGPTQVVPSGSGVSLSMRDPAPDPPPDEAAIDPFAPLTDEELNA